MWGEQCCELEESSQKVTCKGLINRILPSGELQEEHYKQKEFIKK